MLRVMVQRIRVFFLGIRAHKTNLQLLQQANYTARQIRRENAKKAGMDVVAGSFIVGAPDVNRQEILNTIICQRVPIDVPHFNILGAHPGNDV
jgi:hypothetical protein